MLNRRDTLRIATLPLLVAAVGASLGGSSGARAGVTEPGDEALISRLRRGGVALLLRHATTDPGVGDPPGFEPGVCATQRNLSAEGRAQAQRIGAWFQARDLRPAQVRSSAWCRCLDTGRLAFGRVDTWPALNSFFGDSAARDRQGAALRAAVGRIGAGQFEVWVTHQVNVTALTGEFAQMGEGCVLEPAAAGSAPGARVWGRWRESG